MELLQSLLSVLDTKDAVNRYIYLKAHQHGEYVWLDADDMALSPAHFLLPNPISIIGPMHYSGCYL